MFETNGCVNLLSSEFKKDSSVDFKHTLDKLWARKRLEINSETERSGLLDEPTV